MFIDDLKTYIINQGLIKTGATLDLEFYDDALATELMCIAVYDSDPELGRYSIQILSRYKALKTARDYLFTIYNHFFTAYNPKSLTKTIGAGKYVFKPVSKPLFVKKVNGLYHYTMNFEVIGETN